MNSNLKIKKRNKINLHKYLESNVKLKNNVFISNNYSPTINIYIPTSNIYNAIKKRKDCSNFFTVIKLSKTDSDLQNMDYEEAIIFDKRTYLRMYWGFLVDSQIILGTFFTDNYFDLFVIKLSFLVFTFQISFFLNALFYTDEYISKAYHNDGVLDFFSGLPK